MKLLTKILNKKSAWLIALILGLSLVLSTLLVFANDNNKYLTPPATYYGPIYGADDFTPTAGMTVTAWISNTLCGESQTTVYTSVVMYTIFVYPDGPGGKPNCGAFNKIVRFEIDNHVMTPTATWSNNSLHYHPFYAALVLQNVSINGPSSGEINTLLQFEAIINPTNATSPVNYTWQPMPDSGQGLKIASYTWLTLGTKTITVTAQNMANTVSSTHQLLINLHKVHLPLIIKN